MKETIVIAEAGVNHNGSLELAKQLVDAAASSGADYVKFQTFQADKLVTEGAGMAAYQRKGAGIKHSGQLDLLRKLELDPQSHLELIKYCAIKGIAFLSTPFDFDSIDLLKNLGINLGKIPSGEITNLPYLRKMATNFGKLILSTGMSNLGEVADALRVLTGAGKALSDITVLHCTSEYPCPPEDVNLRAMTEMQTHFGVGVGYSDHTTGIEISCAAAALGAVVIEKHFTLDRTMEGPDHAASLEPAELTAMVRGIRVIDRAIGSGTKEPAPSEMENRVLARKSIVASRAISKNEVFSEENLDVKRPGTGLSPMEWDRVIGKIATRDFGKDDLISI